MQTDEWVLSTLESAIDFFILTGNDMMVSYSVCSRLGLCGMGSTLAGLGLPNASTNSGTGAVQRGLDPPAAARYCAVLLC